MLVAGIDVGAEVHHVAVVEQSEAVVTKPSVCEESTPGYDRNCSRCWRAPDHGVAKTCPWRRRARGS